MAAGEALAREPFGSCDICSSCFKGGFLVDGDGERERELMLSDRERDLDEERRRRGPFSSDEDTADLLEERERDVRDTEREAVLDTERW